MEDSSLTWAAVCDNSGDLWVPELAVAQVAHPEAQWNKLSPTQLRLFLETNPSAGPQYQPSNESDARNLA